MDATVHNALLQELRKHIRLSDTEEMLITQSFRYKKVRKNQILVHPPEPAQYEHFVISGCLVQYYINEEGSQHLLVFVPEGWWMTELQSFLQKQESKYFVEAIEESELLVISKDTLDKLLEQVPSLNLYFRLLYQNAIIGQNERLLNVLSTKVNERYIRFLKKYPQLENRIPQYMIASYLGVTPEFLSRAKSKRQK